MASCFIWLAAFTLCCGSLVPAASPDKVPSFQADILPIFLAKCAGCHGAGTPQQGLDIRTLAALLRGGKSGPAIQVGSSTKSLLMEKIVTQQMPPAGPKLSLDEVESIRKWIDRGVSAEIQATVSASGSTVPAPTEEDILPIIQARCVVCHGKREPRGGLDLRTQASRLKGGTSGPAVVPGKPEESLLIRKIESGDMPPIALQQKFSIRAPSDAELDKLRKWIAAGCPPRPEASMAAQSSLNEKDRSFWSFQPPKRPAIPKVKHHALVRNPIDAFLLQKLEEKKLTYSPQAEPLALLRRVYLDLTGLTPAPAEVKNFLADSRPDRYERVVDRLLDSSAYGERWARHWLDLAGYADTEGYGEGAPLRPDFWRYRDYVIRALNSDKPYDKFLVEQIAGDELANYKEEKVTPELIDRLAATGFLRTAPDPTWEPEFAFLPERMNVVADEVAILTSSVLGMTLGCARCHDHKYDPISQRDYYRFTAILQTAYDPYDWRPPKERNLDISLEKDRKEVEERNAPLQREIEKFEQALEVEAKPYREKLLNERLEALPESVRNDLRQAGAKPEKERSELEKYLLEKFKKTFDIQIDELTKKYPDFKTAAEPFRKDIAAAKRKLIPKPHVRALLDMGGEPSGTYLLRRGEALSPAEPVAPGVPEVLSSGLEPYKVTSLPHGSTSSGRRLALARWLTQPNHPLTSRVMVNQLWMRHFAAGLVASPGNFGRSGSPPSHPELLDWLATEFVSSGWSMKHMHRLMVTSAAYRRSSRRDPAKHTADSENVLLSRMPIRRMDSDQLYDSILMATGRLNPAQFGRPEDIQVGDNKEVVAVGSTEGYRRSIYVLQRTSTPVTLLEAFDMPQMNPNCIERSRSNVATQALQMMNSEQIWKLATYMAGRVIDEAGENLERQVEQVFLRALSRPPTETEKKDSRAALDRLAGQWPARLRKDHSASPVEATARWMALAGLCHTVLNSASFIFVD